MTQGYIHSAFNCLKVSGSDAFSYLQSQFSNNLENLPAAQTLYGFFLNNKGKIQTDASIAKINDHWIVYSTNVPQSSLQDILEQNIIMDDVEVEPLPDAVCLSILSALPESVESAWIANDIYNAGVLTELIFEDKSTLDVCLEGLGLQVVDSEVYRNYCVENALPRMGCEVRVGDLPQEVGLGSIGVSYNKGCYLGQEVMMRLHTMGHVRKALYLCELENSLPVGAEVVLGDKRIGEVRSVSADKAIILGKCAVFDVSEEGVSGLRVIKKVDFDHE